MGDEVAPKQPVSTTTFATPHIPRVLVSLGDGSSEGHCPSSLEVPEQNDAPQEEGDKPEV